MLRPAHVGLVPHLVTLALPLAGQSAWQQLQDPGAAGWSVEHLQKARGLAEEIGSAAVMLSHGDHVVVAWGDVERRFRCHSVRKSLLSALYGIAGDKRLVELDATLGKLGIDERTPLTATEKSARLADLLAARSGIYLPAAKEPLDLKRERPERGSAAPGERFHYNNWDFNVAGVAFEQQTGRTIFAAFDDWLAKPLGMQDWRLEDGRYELEPGNSCHPAYDFRLSTRDLCRFGQLFAREGQVGDRQLVPKAWIEASTAVHSTLDDGRSYGLMWWVFPPGSLASYPSLNAQRAIAAIGTGGQVVLVIPAIDFVLVHRGDTDHDRPVRGRDFWRLAELLLTARPAAAPERQPELQSLAARPLPNAEPAPPEHLAVPLEAAQIAALVGKYQVPSLGAIRLFEFEARLFVRLPDTTEAEVFASADGGYFLHSANATMQFERDENGSVVVAEITLDGRRMRAARVR